jgi:hypothetical protein
MVIICLLSVFGVFSEKNEKDMILLKQWDNQVFLDETGSAVPMLYDDLNSLYKVDPDEPFLHVYNSRFEEIEKIRAPFSFMGAEISWSGLGGLFYKKDNSIYIIRINGKVSPLKIDESHIENGHFLINGLLVIEDENGKLRGYLQTDSSVNTLRKMDDTEVRSYIKKNASTLKGFALDADGIPLFQGIPWSKSGFKKYWG